MPYQFSPRGWETDLPRDENRGSPHRKPVPRGENRQPRVENRPAYLMLNIPCGENWMFYLKITWILPEFAGNSESHWMLDIFLYLMVDE